MVKLQKLDGAKSVTVKWWSVELKKKKRKKRGKKKNRNLARGKKNLK